MTATKYIILTLITLVASSFLVSISGIDPMLNVFLAGGTLANGLRIGILALLVALLVSDPPRSLKLRAVLGVSSVVMLYLCVSQLLAYSTFIVDAFVYLELAIVFAIEALEITQQRFSPRKFVTR